MIENTRAVLSGIWRDKTGRIGLVLVVAILLFAIVGPLFSIDPNRIDIPARFEAPSFTHLLGTDNLGRDLFARTAKATRFAIRSCDCPRQGHRSNAQRCPLRAHQEKPLP